MQDDTTTSDASEDSQASATDENPVDNRAQLEKDATTEAVETTQDTSQTSDEASDEPEVSDNSDEDAEIRDWAAKKNLPLDDPIKVAKMYREAEKQLGKKGAEATELKKAVTTASNETDTDDIQALRNEVAAMNFKIDNPEAVALEPQMIQILEEKPWLAGDLSAVLDIAKGRNAPTQAEVAAAAKKAGSKEALASVAQAQRAAPPRASASTRESSRGLTDADVANMTPAEYAQAKADGKLDPWPKL